MTTGCLAGETHSSSFAVQGLFSALSHTNLVHFQLETQQNKRSIGDALVFHYKAGIALCLRYIYTEGCVHGGLLCVELVQHGRYPQGGRLGTDQDQFAILPFAPIGCSLQLGFLGFWFYATSQILMS